MKNADNKLETLRYFNRNARVTGPNGSQYHFEESDFVRLNKKESWISKTKPSASLCRTIFSMGRRKFKKFLFDAQIIDLCAETLNITPQALINELDWKTQYMDFHG